MSFNQSANGRTYAPGWFLAEEECARETVQVSATHSQAVTIGAHKIVPAGAVIPSNDGNAKGLLYEDVEVTTGDMPGSLVTRGAVYEDRLPAAIESSAEAVLPGIKVITAVPSVVRPSSFNGGDLTALTVTSEAGTGSGKTDVSFTGYTPKTGERTVYKLAAAAVPVAMGEVLSVGSSAGQWTAASFPLDELAATTGYITVAVVDSTNAVIAAGSDAITAKA